MAVLHTLLSGSPAALAGSDPVVTKHEWIDTHGKKFLLGANALEQRILGGYVKQLHPEAPRPQVHRTNALFDTIPPMRQRMEDLPHSARTTSGASRSPGSRRC